MREETMNIKIVILTWHAVSVVHHLYVCVYVCMHVCVDVCILCITFYVSMHV
jgi:hypothetical protein